MRKILVSNDVPFHYDVVESAIAKYDELLKIKKRATDSIDVFLVSDRHSVVPGLIYEQLSEYLKQEYKVNMLTSVNYSLYEYQIHCTVVASDAPATDGNIRPFAMKNQRGVAYISHDVSPDLLKLSNVFFLSKFARADIPDSRVFTVDKLPKFFVKKTAVPTFIVQGSFVRSKYDRTRDYSILEDALSVPLDKTEFLVHIVGDWHKDAFYIEEFIDMSKIHQSNVEKVKVTLNSDWRTFHSICASSDCIMPLVSKKHQPERFNRKITSSIFFGRSHKIKMFVDSDFIEAYSLSEDEYFLYKRDSVAADFRRAVSVLQKQKMLR